MKIEEVAGRDHALSGQPAVKIDRPFRRRRWLRDRQFRHLTRNEQLVAGAIAEGYENTTGAKRLGIEEAQFYSIATKIYSKLGINELEGRNMRVVLAHRILVAEVT